MKVLALKDGGDWADASVDFVVLPEGVDIMSELEIYLATVRYGNDWIRFPEWLRERGARYPSDDELEEVELDEARWDIRDRNKDAKT